MPAALTTVAARAAEGARAAFRPAELPLKDDCRRRRDERGERRERRRERGQSNVRDRVREKKQNTIGEFSSHDSTISQAASDAIELSGASRATEASASQKNASRRGRLAIAGKKPSVPGVTRVSADGIARSRRTRGARARAATYLGQHGRVDSENLRFGEGKGRE